MLILLSQRDKTSDTDQPKPDLLNLLAPSITITSEIKFLNTHAHDNAKFILNSKLHHLIQVIKINRWGWS